MKGVCLLIPTIWLVQIIRSGDLVVAIATAIALGHVVTIFLETSAAVLQRRRRVSVQLWNVRNTPELALATEETAMMKVVDAPSILYFWFHGAFVIGVGRWGFL